MLAITLVAIVAAAKLLQAYGSALASIASVAAASQRPQLSIQSVSATSSGLQIVVENKGTEPARVLGAYIFEYSASGTPTNAVNCTNLSPTYVPVGGYFTCNLTYSSLSALMGVGRPLRMEVLTSRGPILLGFPPLLGNLIINIQQPQWMEGIPSESTYRVQIWCPASLASQGAPPEISVSVPSVANITGPTSRAIYLPNLTAVGPCDVQLLYIGLYRVVKSEFAVNSPTLAEAEQASVRIVMDQLVYLTPGGTATVTFKMPEVYTELTHRPLTPWDVSSFEYDFSWYYYPALEVGGSYVHGIEGSTTYFNNLLEIAQSLMENGIVYASSPQACPVENLTALQAFDLGAKTFFGSFALDNGVPFVAGPCYPSPGEPMLTLEVPLVIPSGWKYLVIPVFSIYATTTSLNQPLDNVGASTSLSGPGTITTLWSGSGSVTGPGAGAMQMTAVYLVDDTSSAVGSTPSNYTLTINLYANDPGYEVVGVVTLSKIVIIPLPPGFPSAMCEYLVTTPNTLPFATVNLTNGQIVSNASVELNYAISTSYFNSPFQATNYMYLYVNPQQGGYIINGQFYATQGNVQIDGNSILGENAVPYYIQNASYSVTISGDVFGNGYVVGGLYAYTQPYRAYQWYYDNTYLYVEYLPSWYEQQVESSNSWVFLFDSPPLTVPGSPHPIASMQVTVNGEPGDYIILALFAASQSGMNPAPSISVTNGQVRLAPTNFNVVTGTAYFPVVVLTTSPTTTITITPPANGVGAGLVGLINVEVVRPPQLSYAQDVDDTLNAPVGIMLVNVTSPTGSVTAELYRADLGELLATWGFPVSSQGANYLLNAGALGSGGWDVGLKYFDQQVPYLLLVYGAYCRSSSS